MRKQTKEGTKTVKKTVALFVAAVMLAGTLVPAYAENIVSSGSQISTSIADTQVAPTTETTVSDNAVVAEDADAASSAPAIPDSGSTAPESIPVPDAVSDNASNSASAAPESSP